MTTALHFIAAMFYRIAWLAVLIADSLNYHASRIHLKTQAKRYTT